MIETFKTKENGYHPFLISIGWQVAKLNFTPEQAIENINKMDKHLETDEAFILFGGRGILVAKDENQQIYNFLDMEKGVVYNIPKGCWHNIILFKDSEIIIVEKDRTHENDYVFWEFDGEKKEKFLTSYANFSKKGKK